MGQGRKTADRKKVMDTSKSTDCPKCGKPTRIVKRIKDRERNVPGGVSFLLRLSFTKNCNFFSGPGSAPGKSSVNKKRNRSMKPRLRNCNQVLGFFAQRRWPSSLTISPRHFWKSSSLELRQSPFAVEQRASRSSPFTRASRQVCR